MNKKIFLDTAPLTLLLIGLIDENYVEKYQGTKQFSKQNFSELSEALVGQKIFTTPHVLTEVSHFTFENRIRDEYKKPLSAIIKKLITEKYIAFKDILSNNYHFYFGFADISLWEASKNDIIITSDKPLADKLKENGGNVLKFIPQIGFVSY